MSPTAVLTVIKGVTSKRDNCHHGCHPEVSLAVKIGTCERVTDWPTGCTWRHLCQQDLLMATITFPCYPALNSTFLRLSQYCLWLTSDLMAKPALAPAHRRRNLKMESPLGPSITIYRLKNYICKILCHLVFTLSCLISFCIYADFLPLTRTIC